MYLQIHDLLDVLAIYASSQINDLMGELTGCVYPNP